MTADNSRVNNPGSLNPDNPTKPDQSLPLAGLRIIGITVMWAVALARRAHERGAYGARAGSADIVGLRIDGVV